MQYIARHSLTRGAAQARNLNAARTIAPSVLNETISLVGDQSEVAVQSRRAVRTFKRGALLVQQGEMFFLVESNVFAGRFYCLVKRNGVWMSSASDARTTVKLAAKLAA